jgi:hypothetical protein
MWKNPAITQKNSFEERRGAVILYAEIENQLKKVTDQ